MTLSLKYQIQTNMALQKELLLNTISSFSDKDFASFISYPENTLDTANLFSEALVNYAISITPPSLTIPLAKSAFMASMSMLELPYSNKEFQAPFTVGFVAHEAKFNLFVKYIKLRSGYISDPKLDTLTTQAILNKIRLGYNSANPNLALTDDIIRYCQALANELYFEKLLTSKSKRLLQVDGIIGDETINISFTDSYNIAPQISETSDTRSSNIINFKKIYNDQIFLQPISWGQISIDFYLEGKIKSRLIASEFYNKWVKSRNHIDNTLVPINKTQSDAPNVDYSLLISSNGSSSKPFSYYKSEYERRHMNYDPIWKANKIKSTEEFTIFSNLTKKIFEAKPMANKDGLDLLSRSIKIFTTQLALGMNPVFTGVPPITPLIFDPVKVKGASGGSAKDCVNLLSNIINAWFLTGTAINNQTATTVPWL